MSAECRTCVYWNPRNLAQLLRGDSHDNYGYCHRYAPRAQSSDESYHDRPYGRWPTTFEQDWCGDYQPRERPQPEGASEK